VSQSVPSSTAGPLAADLSEGYRRRFGDAVEYRRKVWTILAGWFAAYVPANGTVLDLGCGWGEFINNATAAKKFAMDLNPDAPHHLDHDVTFLHQDCSEPWSVEPGTLDAVFTSNFFEHLPDKPALTRTLQHAYDALRPGGRIVCMGPNAAVAPGSYWDFYDHYLPLTEKSMAEGLKLRGFTIERCERRFLPYTMSEGRQPPANFLKAYLRLPFAWRFFGAQFLVVARK
jgi:SAM-dependent methyltransferase